MRLVHPIKFKDSRRFWVGIVAISIVLKIASGIFLVSKVPSVKIAKDKFGQVLAMAVAPTAFKAPGNAYELPSAKWVPQTFNNCGPAATSMVLQYFGYDVPQTETKAHLRTSPDDKNVFINEISAYIKADYGVDNKVLFNGDLKTIKTLVANGVYVVVEDWLHPNEDIGHVLIIRGFNDAEGVLIADDSYFGVGIKYPYSTWDETQWKPYNREFMPVYRHEKEDLVRAIVGENWDEKTMYKNSVVRNQNDANINPNDMYAWFNLGTSYYALGEYQKAKIAFEKSQAIGWPKRMLWYNIDPVKTYNKLQEYQKAIDTANLGLWYNSDFSELIQEIEVAKKGLSDLR
ncbi:MAG TPA: C39 family peptidase [Patescibacteria group bacterium]|nr:C39 family peptidase [Patescibacteria group bacterium]